MEEKQAGGNKGKFYAVRAIAGQEYNVALIVKKRIEALKLPIKSILVIDELKGFVFIEADSYIHVDKAIAGIKYVKGRIPGILKYEELEKYIISKPVIEEIEENDVVEVIGGPFRGLRGKVTHINKVKKEVTLELFDVAYPLPVTIDAEYLHIIEKAKEKRPSQE